MKIARFNDAFALVIILVIVIVWGLDTYLNRAIRPELAGGSLVIVQQIASYYFRKKEGEPNSSG